MSIPPAIVASARMGWKWQWNQLMNGLAPADAEGNYTRTQSQALDSKPPKAEDLLNRSSEDFPLLVVARSCPWAHRTWLLYELKDLNKSLNILIAKPNPKAGLWKIDPSWKGCKSVLEIYKLCNAPPTHRATVPVLVDPKPNNKKTPELLGNESAQLVETLNIWPTEESTPNFYPKELHEEIKDWQELLQDSVNNGVYKCGFARNQRSYEEACKTLFNSLKIVEKNLSIKGPWLCGEKLTIADIRLFPTMIRWESVYAPLFRCNQSPLTKFPNLLQWRKNFFNLPKVSKTCDSKNWRNDYFGALFPLNPSNIVPLGPNIQEIINSA
ncbi:MULTISPECIES: glutathione S-transferase family protein [Prochlorococcus]|uniref:Predicted glutathione S-transferase n=1 Tax=Prochlorococcus marinus (strain SARG / CCMP1375 / SS120) TaxID=167539 RepID=Q7VDW5_PROMA|nr:MULTISPECIES: glutathione S-transferase family protein [Prochlorococcus]AAP99296.1 Predicted glutathione S-transferase [Prochlorococcus marinus subsp. marinus str. CCMP1375]KGG11432.1 Glutathione S-transferase [Prochlorococcus marinus str. LG]KGG18612.1 Glutathione S-transferase [Prochlorococcus marinus str. SS2]KGG22885.1 Glutathione S-transferase [Prochlorococcus marinus str. SS35]KGG32761.1 Glutathione S-transferase [Prochlorococcus marinus str. SS51]